MNLSIPLAVAGRFTEGEKVTANVTAHSATAELLWLSLRCSTILEYVNRVHAYVTICIEMSNKSDKFGMLGMYVIIQTTSMLYFC